MVIGFECKGCQRTGCRARVRKRQMGLIMTAEGDGHKCAKGTRRVLGMSAQGAERADYGCQRVLGKSVQGALDRAHMNIGSNTRESTQKTGRMANHINISTQSEALDN
eukprot:scaffold270264_cov22-Tisochrysis_lutea.AAC.1